VYAITPFLPPTWICISNDDYLARRHNFDALLASSSSSSSSLPSSADDGVPILDPSSDYYPSLIVSYDDAMHSLLFLLISKRLTLYFLATIATAYAGWRAYATGVHSMRHGMHVGPGDALDGLNREVLSGERYRQRRRAVDAPLDALVHDDDAGGIDEVIEDNGDYGGEGIGPFASLIDDGPTSSEDVGTFLAVSLPLVLGALLAISYAMSGNGGPVDDSLTGGGGGTASRMRS
jgi:hypothetical protein